MKIGGVFAALVAGAVACGVLAPPTAGGQVSPDPRTRRAELSDAIEGGSAAEIAAIKELDDATARRQQLQAQVAALDGQFSEAAQAAEAAEAEVARITTEMEALQREIDGLRAEIDKSKARFNESTVALYKGSGNVGGSVLTLLSTAAGTHELVEGSKYLGENSRRLHRELQRQGSLKDRLDAAQRDLNNEKSKAQAAKRVAAGKHDRVVQLRAATDAERDQAAAAEAHEQQIIEGIRAQKTQFEAEYNAVQAQIEAQIAATVSRGNPTAPSVSPPGPPSGNGRGNPTAPSVSPPGPASGNGRGNPTAPSVSPPGPSSRNGRFSLPVDGPIGSRFGPRTHPIYGGTRMHNGVDIGASSGTPIKAADSGTVVMAGSNGGYGNWTLIDHGGGLATGYAHQSSIGVRVGQRVTRGEIIGRVGSTGASTGPHLHWEVRVNGNPVNPMGWV